jgi:hypothetical protein
MASKKNKDIAGRFIANSLPTLKKELSLRKKEPFHWSDYAHYFKPGSKYIQTFVLPLFHFLETDEIICSRYGCFDGKHMVKTTDGFQRVMLLSKYCTPDELDEQTVLYMTKKYGREWFKIPSKDGFRAKSASAAGHEGLFKVRLLGIFEDSFVDQTSLAPVLCINPILSFEPVLAAVGSSSSSKSTVSDSVVNTQVEGEDKTKKRKRKQTPVVEPVEVGAQDVELVPLPIQSNKRVRKTTTTKTKGGKKQPVNEKTEENDENCEKRSEDIKLKCGTHSPPQHQPSASEDDEIGEVFGTDEEYEDILEKSQQPVGAS